jgi:hypothetical protein
VTAPARVRATARRRSTVTTAATIAALGFAVGLAGDACHVASGTTRYEWDGVPTIWRSAIWFPLLVAGAVVLAAWLAHRQDLPGVAPWLPCLYFAAGVVAARLWGAISS